MDIECAWYCCSCGHGPWILKTYELCPECNNHPRCPQCCITEEIPCENPTEGASPSRGYARFSNPDNRQTLDFASPRYPQDTATSYARGQPHNNPSQSFGPDRHEEYSWGRFSQDTDYQGFLTSSDVLPRYGCYSSGSSTASCEVPAIGKSTETTIQNCKHTVNPAQPAPLWSLSFAKPDQKRRNRRRSIFDYDGGGDAGAVDNYNRLKTPVRKSARGIEPGRRIVCPFFKRNPFRYWHCQNYDLKDVSRVKDHLKRFHFLHECYRCFKVLSTKRDVIDHQDIKKTPECTRRQPMDRYPIEGVTEAMLSSWKSTTGPNAHSMDEQWKDLYKVVFPNDLSIPSSCYCEDEDYARTRDRRLQETSEQELHLEHELDISSDVLRSRTEQYMRNWSYLFMGGLRLAGNRYVVRIKLSLATRPLEVPAHMMLRYRTLDDGEDIEEGPSMDAMNTLPNVAKTKALADVKTITDNLDLHQIMLPDEGAIYRNPYTSTPVSIPVYSDACQLQDEGLYWEQLFAEEPMDTSDTLYALGAPLLEPLPGFVDSLVEEPQLYQSEEEMRVRQTLVGQLNVEDCTAESEDPVGDEFELPSVLDLSQLLDDESNSMRLEY